MFTNCQHLFLADLSSCQMNLTKYYDGFTDVQLYTNDKEEDHIAVDDIYVPMVWKKVEDPENIHKDVEINSPLELLNQVENLCCLDKRKV